MKTLYISINNEIIQSDEELEVLNYDLDSDFFFYLGEKIVKGCKVEYEKALITDFNTQENKESYQQIIAQWGELKAILFSEEYEGKFEFTLPNEYIHWLRYNNNERYKSVYERNFSSGESIIIPIDLEDLYEDLIEELQRWILRKLKKNDMYLEIDEIVFNDDSISRKSSIVRTIKDKYDGIGFKAYRKWILEHEDATLRVCEKCKKTPCECGQTSSEDFFPYKGITLGGMSIKEIDSKNLTTQDPFIRYDIDDNVYLLGLEDNNNFIVAHINSKLPKEWIDLLGCRFGTFYRKCNKFLKDNKFDIIYSRKDTEIVAISPSKKYLVDLSFDKDSYKFVGICIMLNQCPHCKSLHLVCKEIDYETIPYCTDCNKYYFPNCGEDEYNDETPICPCCCSDDVEDDSDYLQYTCNDCGHNWGHDDTVECPECGSNDVENDGTDNLQYECNVCGHKWGDDEHNNDDNDELHHFFPVHGITLGKTTVKQAKRNNYINNIDYDKKGVVSASLMDIDGSEGASIGNFLCEKAFPFIFTEMRITRYEKMFEKWYNLGLNWLMSYNECVLFFKNRGYTIEKGYVPHHQEHKGHNDTTKADFRATAPDNSVGFLLKFTCEAKWYDKNNRGTLYSIYVTVP